MLMLSPFLTPPFPPFPTHSLTPPLTHSLPPPLTDPLPLSPTHPILSPTPSLSPLFPASFDAPAAEFVQLLGSLSRRLKAFSGGPGGATGASTHEGGSLRGSINAGGMSPRPMGVSLIGHANTPSKPSFSSASSVINLPGGGAGGSFPIPLDGFPAVAVASATLSSSTSTSSAATATAVTTKLTEMGNTHHDGCVVLEDEEDGTDNDGHTHTPNPRRKLSVEITTTTTTATTLNPHPTASHDDKDNALMSWSALAAEAEVILQGN